MQSKTEIEKQKNVSTFFGMDKNTSHGLHLNSAKSESKQIFTNFSIFYLECQQRLRQRISVYSMITYSD